MRRMLPIPVVFCLLSTCLAQPTTAPATQPAWQITITSVEGINQGRSGPDQPWTPLAVGMKFSRGGELRNGPRSIVKFATSTGREIRLDRLGRYRIDPDTLELDTTAGSSTIVSSSTLRVYSGPPRLRMPDVALPPVPQVTTTPVIGE